MHAKRLALALLSVTVGVAASGGLTTSSGQAPGDRPGLSYGALRGEDSVWLRLDGSRRLIAALEIPVAMSRDRCSNRKGWFTFVYGGAEWYQVIYVGATGRFKKRMLDRWSEDGIRYVEDYTVSGTITDERVTGKVEGTVRRTMPSGRVVRCSFGPQSWAAVN